jgi:hypothetical protein
MKKIDFDQTNAYRGKVDMAVSGALRLAPCNQGLFIYGNGKFNIQTSLPMLCDVNVPPTYVTVKETVMVT